MANAPFTFKRRPLSVELVDKLLSLYGETGGDNDEFMELFWGKADEEDILVDLLTLARVALVHLHKEPTDDAKPTKSSNRLSRDGKGKFRKATDENDTGLHGVAEKQPPSGD